MQQPSLPATPLPLVSVPCMSFPQTDGADIGATTAIVQPPIDSSSQVRVGDPSGSRCSSLLPTLRRRASEPLPRSHRLRAGATHTRYTSGHCSGYTLGFAQRDGGFQSGYESGVSRSRSLESRHPGENAHERGRTLARTLDDGNSRTPDDNFQRNAYTANIRAMAGQMYGDPPTRSWISDAHTHTHSRGLTQRQRHLRLSGGL